MKREDAQKLVRILQHRIPNQATTIELFDREQLEIGDFEVNFDLGDEFGHLTWKTIDGWVSIDVNDICKVIDTETEKVIVSIDLEAYDQIEVKPLNDN